MTARADLPRLDDLPIPADVRPGAGWTEQMLDLAVHIGPHATLSIVAEFGGQRLSIPRDADRSPFLDLIGRDKAAKVAWLYGGERFQVPVARAAVHRAKRGGILTLVRSKSMTVGDAAIILGTSRNYVTYLVNTAQESLNAPATPRSLLTRQDNRQLDLFASTD